jgi:hypothetical protein
MTSSTSTSKRECRWGAVHALLGPPDQTDGPTLDYYNVDYEHTSLLGDCVFLEVESNDGQLRHAAVVRDG